MALQARAGDELGYYHYMCEVLDQILCIVPHHSPEMLVCTEYGGPNNRPLLLTFLLVVTKAGRETSPRPRGPGYPGFGGSIRHKSFALGSEGFDSLILRYISESSQHLQVVDSSNITPWSLCVFSSSTCLRTVHQLGGDLCLLSLEMLQVRRSTFLLGNNNIVDKLIPTFPYCWRCVTYVSGDCGISGFGKKKKGCRGHGGAWLTSVAEGFLSLFDAVTDELLIYGSLKIVYTVYVDMFGKVSIA